MGLQIVRTSFEFASILTSEREGCYLNFEVVVEKIEASKRRSHPLATISCDQNVLHVKFRRKRTFIAVITCSVSIIGNVAGIFSTKQASKISERAFPKAFDGK